MQGDLHVRFGGRLWETYHRKMARCPLPSLHVKFAKEPLLLSVEMTDFLHDGESVDRPNNAQEIYLEKLGNESPMLVKLIMKSIYKQNKRTWSFSESSASTVSSIIRRFSELK